MTDLNPAHHTPRTPEIPALPDIPLPQPDIIARLAQLVHNNLTPYRLGDEIGYSLCRRSLISTAFRDAGLVFNPETFNPASGNPEDVVHATLKQIAPSLPPESIDTLTQNLGGVQSILNLCIIPFQTENRGAQTDTRITEECIPCIA